MECPARRRHFQFPAPGCAGVQVPQPPVHGRPQHLATAAPAPPVQHPRGSPLWPCPLVSELTAQQLPGAARNAPSVSTQTVRVSTLGTNTAHLWALWTRNGIGQSLGPSSKLSFRLSNMKFPTQFPISPLWWISLSNYPLNMHNLESLHDFQRLLRALKLEPGASGVQWLHIWGRWGRRCYPSPRLSLRPSRDPRLWGGKKHGFKSWLVVQ